MSADRGSLISVDRRPLRDIGNAYGFSLDKRALEELGALDEDGQVKDGIDARIKITRDGTVTGNLTLNGSEQP